MQLPQTAGTSRHRQAEEQSCAETCRRSRGVRNVSRSSASYLFAARNKHVSAAANLCELMRTCPNLSKLTQARCGGQGSSAARACYHGGNGKASAHAVSAPANRLSCVPSACDWAQQASTIPSPASRGFSARHRPCYLPGVRHPDMVHRFPQGHCGPEAACLFVACHGILQNVLSDA